MCMVQSGVLQGCPPAALLFVVAMEPFLILFQLSIVDAGLGIVKVCADDIAIVLKNISALCEVSKTFKIAEQVAGLILKTRKCFVIPLYAPFC